MAKVDTKQKDIKYKKTGQMALDKDDPRYKGSATERIEKSTARNKVTSKVTKKGKK